MTKDYFICPCFYISCNSSLLILSVFLFEDMLVSLYRYSTNNICFIHSLSLKIDLAINRLYGK